MRVPLVWILRGPKAGDYAQLQLLARAIERAVDDQAAGIPALGIVAARIPETDARRARPSRRPIALEPPWPDLVLTAGRRNELVARWIRDASGGRSRIVHVGRPWSNPSRFDLVVSNRQYLLDAGDNVIVNDLPLTDLTEASLAPERPRVGREVGCAAASVDGRCWSAATAVRSCFTPKCARELAVSVNALKRSPDGGSVLLTHECTDAAAQRRCVC